MFGDKIRGIGKLVKNCYFGGLFTSFIKINKLFILSNIVLLGSGVVLAFLLFFSAFKLKYSAFSVTAVQAISFILFLGAGYIFWSLAAMLAARKRYKLLQDDNNKLCKYNFRLEHDFNELLTHANITSAALDSTSLDCFIDNIVKVFRTGQNAQEMTVFSYDNNIVCPHTYYQISESCELSLSFIKNFQIVLNLETDNFNSNLLSAGGLTLSYQNNNLLVKGKFFYAEKYSGVLKISFFAYSENTPLLEKALLTLVNKVLFTVNIDNCGLQKVLASKDVVIVETESKKINMALKLNYADTDLGIIKIGFKQLLYQEYIQKQKLIRSTARSVSKVLYHDRIYQLAIKDGLTNLYNKRFLLESLQQQFSLFVRNRVKFSFILLDLDHFKKINDTWGHITGDMVLKEIAEVMVSHVREADIACRFGGEELAVLLPETSGDGAFILAERIRTAIAAKIFKSEKKEIFSVSASFGVVEVDFGMVDAHAMISYADQALYEAKDSGRNMVVISKGSEKQNMVNVA